MDHGLRTDVPLTHALSRRGAITLAAASAASAAYPRRAGRVRRPASRPRCPGDGPAARRHPARGHHVGPGHDLLRRLARRRPHRHRRPARRHRPTSCCRAPPAAAPWPLLGRPLRAGLGRGQRRHGRRGHVWAVDGSSGAVVDDIVVPGAVFLNDLVVTARCRVGHRLAGRPAHPDRGHRSGHPTGARPRRSVPLTGAWPPSGRDTQRERHPRASPTARSCSTTAAWAVCGRSTGDPASRRRIAGARRPRSRRR